MRFVIRYGKEVGLCDEHASELVTWHCAAGSPPKIGDPGAQELGVAPAQTSGPAPAIAEPAGKEAREETKMPAKNRIDLEAFRRDYEAGTPNKDLETKYGLGSNSVPYWARKAGAKMRHGAAHPQGGRPPGSRNNRKARTRPLRKLQREPAEMAPEFDDGVVTLCLTGHALDAIWAGLPIEKKARLIEALAA